MEQVASEQIDLTGLALSAVIAEAARAAKALRDFPHFRYELYESYKRKMARLNPTPDEYERAIKMLTEALNI